MDEKPVTADVVVACLFAGGGAWAAQVSVGPVPEYASELFGPGHSSPEYPDNMHPVVTLTIPGNRVDNTATPSINEYRNHNGSVEVTFSLLGAVLDANVTQLMFDVDGPSTQGTGGEAYLCVNPADTGQTDSADTGCTDPVAAPGTIASIVSGGRKGDSSITILVEPAGDNTTDVTGNALVERNSSPAGRTQTISFNLPRLANLALAGADSTDDKTDNDVKRVWLRADSRIISGEFTDGPLTTQWGITGFPYVPAVAARDSLTVEVSDGTAKMIAIDDKDDLTAFRSVKGANKDGYVTLGTVTIMTKQVVTPTSAEQKATPRYQFMDGDSGSPTTRTITDIPKPAVTKAIFRTLHDLDGDPVNEGLRGTFSVDAMGTRDLFNDGDMLFVDYDGDGKMGSGEGIDIDGDMAEGDSLSIDPDKSDSFNENGVGNFVIYYMPGGKDHINHGAMINLTAMVEYSDPSAIDEKPQKNSTAFNFDGVNDEAMAYAIPHSTNGIGDKGNVRVRCEASMGCRVFLECWDDMGMRGFGEAPMVAGNSVAVWSGEAIEGVVGVDEAMSRHSCRILSKGDVTVQQLTRDGNSGTLVNNTYVGD